MNYKNEPYFPGDGGIVAQGEARRAAESARASAQAAGRHAAEVGEIAEKGLARTSEQITDVRWALSDLTSRMQDLEHQARVLFEQDEAQVNEIEALKGQAGEVASVVVGLSKRLDTSQEVQKEMIECLAQLREALMAIAEHVAQMEAGSRDVVKMVGDILEEELEGFPGAGEGEEGTVGLPRQTREYMEAVDILCREFWLYDEEAMRDFNFSTTPPQIRPEKRENFERSPIKEHRQRFAGEFHGVITENDFRTFLCENPEAEGFVFANRVFYRERTKDKYNELVEIICDNIIENRQEELGNHPA